MRLINSDQWLKILFSGGLLVILVQGLIQIPEVRGRLFPGVFWREKLANAQTECIKVGKLLLKLRENYLINGAVCSNFQEERRLAAAPAPSGSVLDAESEARHLQQQLYLARKDYVNALRKLNYLEVLLEDLLVTIPPGDTARPAESSIRAMLRYCQGYRKELVMSFDKLRK